MFVLTVRSGVSIPDSLSQSTKLVAEDDRAVARKVIVPVIWLVRLKDRSGRDTGFHERLSPAPSLKIT